MEIVQLIIDHCEAIARRIEEFDIDENRFSENDVFTDMLLMPVFQIGELAGALSQEYRDGHPDIPWRAMRGLRNVIAHDYGSVDSSWVWRTICHDIPALHDMLVQTLR